MIDLKGSSVLVTGASSGIGREIARLLATLNASVVASGRNADRLRETLDGCPGESHAIAPFDLSATAEIPKWVQSLTVRHGAFSAIVHAAGKQVTAPIRFTTPEAVDDVCRTNLYSALMLARGFATKAVIEDRHR